jgi:enoyl-CoA hydratase/carnithine racemase
MKNLSSLSGADGGSGGSLEATAGRGEVEMPGDASWGEDLRGTYTHLMSVRKPIVGAINGAVAGMGVPIVLSCDVRFMNQDAVLTTSFAQRGLIAEWGLSWLLGRLVGPAHALDLLYTARKVKGSEAAQIGLVNWAVPAEDVLSSAQNYVRDLAMTSSPASMAVMKRQVYSELHAGLAEAEKQSIEFMKESFHRPDFAEGVKSFLERRPPEFPRFSRS